MNEGQAAGYYCLEWLGRQSCLVEKITTFEDEVVALPNARLHTTQHRLKTKLRIIQLISRISLKRDVSAWNISICLHISLDISNKLLSLMQESFCLW
ncbi:hypothetical protein HMPREF1121_01035 [Porphyromonas sp. KLE 1280]|nr:hypothetical protein HMPREF1121_01035 [Porphyromonas sp. KLE 1280]